MEVFSVTEFQERWDELIERVENGETLGIVNDNGESAVMMLTDDPVYRMYKDHDEPVRTLTHHLSEPDQNPYNNKVIQQINDCHF